MPVNATQSTRRRAAGRATTPRLFDESGPRPVTRGVGPRVVHVTDLPIRFHVMSALATAMEQRRITAVVGETGIGKTLAVKTAAAEYLGAFEAGTRLVLYVSAADAGTPLELYGVIRERLRETLKEPQLHAPAESVGEARRALVDQLLAQDVACVVLDDAHALSIESLTAAFDLFKALDERRTGQALMRGAFRLPSATGFPMVFLGHPLLGKTLRTVAATRGGLVSLEHVGGVPRGQLAATLAQLSVHFAEAAATDSAWTRLVTDAFAPHEEVPIAVLVDLVQAYDAMLDQAVADRRSGKWNPTALGVAIMRHPALQG